MAQDLPPRPIIERTMHAVVQILALQRGMMGNYSPAWTGSGTIISPGGIIVTNCHVANPRALGMPAPNADVLAVAITERSDNPPAVTYIAKIAAQSPERDLAVLQIVSTLDGKRVSNLDLPFLEVGDSDNLELGDTVAIFGYPGIGGETVTFTAGAVAGFSSEQGIDQHRAWIKTDATIAGGNSGGTAVNRSGQLVAIPTQAAAGSGITPVDARPVVDTNRDGRIDQRDTPMAIGGFINGLRPINLARPLLQQAGWQPQTQPRTSTPTVAGRVQSAAKAGSTAQAPTAPKPTAKSPASPPKTTPKPAAKPATQPAPQPTAPKSSPRTAGPTFGNLVFSRQVTQDGRPVGPASVLPSGGQQLFASFDFSGMSNGLTWRQVWAVNDQPVIDQAGKWEDGASGRKALVIANRQGLPDGEYHLIVTVKDAIMVEGRVTVGRRVDDTDSEISGSVVDAQTGQGIAGALVIALKPDVKVQDFVRLQRKDMAFTSARTDAKGAFTFPQQLPKGQAYGLIVVGRGYQDMAIEAALRVSANAPERAQINPIPMQRS